MTLRSAQEGCNRSTVCTREVSSPLPSQRFPVQGTRVGPAALGDDETGLCGESVGLYLGGLRAPGFAPPPPGRPFVLQVLGGLELGRGDGDAEALYAAAVPFENRHPPADAGTAVLHG